MSELSSSVCDPKKHSYPDINILHTNSANTQEHRKRNMYNKITLLAALALILDILSCSIPYWVRDGSGNSGLWMFCTRRTACSYFDINRLPAWFKAVQATEVVGLVVAAIGTALMTIIIWEKERIEFAAFCISRVAVILFFIAAVFTLVGVILYGVNTDSGEITFDVKAGSPGDLHAAFILAILSAFMYIIVGLFISLKKPGYISL